MISLHLIAQQLPALAALAAVILGLIIGSFLNVVIYRLPLMIERQWRDAARSFLQELARHNGHSDSDPSLTAAATAAADSHKDAAAPFNLAVPPSHCPHCKHRIRPWENIPLVSWLLLRGRCSACAAPIPLRYPLTEALCALLTLAVLWQLGPTATAAATLVFTWTLICLALIDLDTGYLHDELTLPLLWGGLLFNTLPWGWGFTDAADALCGAAAGYLSLWSLNQAYRLLRGHDGMGGGDFKLLAALGAWTGTAGLLPAVMLASAAGLLFALLQFRGSLMRDSRIPFGPFLALGGWVALLWGRALTDGYLALMSVFPS